MAAAKAGDADWQRSGRLVDVRLRSEWDNTYLGHAVRQRVGTDERVRLVRKPVGGRRMSKDKESCACRRRLWRFEAGSRSIMTDRGHGNAHGPALRTDLRADSTRTRTSSPMPSPGLGSSSPIATWARKLALSRPGGARRRPDSGKTPFPRSRS